MNRTSDVIVVGGGIVGSFVAYFLARKGLSTKLIERAGIGSQASKNNPGGLNPLHGPGIPGPMALLALQSFDLHLKYGSEIQELSGTLMRPRLATRIHLALEPSDLPGLRQIVERHEQAKGFGARLVTRRELLDIEPRLSSRVLEGVLTEGNAVVDSYYYTAAVSRAAVAKGASLYEGDVVATLTDGARVIGVKCDENTFHCESIVFATGAWAAGPASWMGLPIDIRPLKGQLLLADIEGRPFQHDFTWRSAALYPFGANKVWLGGTEEDVGFDTMPSQEGRKAIMRLVSQIFPAAPSMPVVKHVAGLRPVTPDGLPLIGRAPGWDNAYLAMGGGRKGMLLSSGMARAVADLIAEGTTAIDIQPCTPARFVKAS